MSENSPNSRKNWCEIFLVILAMFLLVWLMSVSRENRALTVKNVLLSYTISNLEQNNELLLWKVIECQKNQNATFNDGKTENSKSVPSHFDVPTAENKPRLVSNGIFPMKNSQFLEHQAERRKPGDLQNVAVLVEAHNREDTQRWIVAMNRYRHHKDARKDLQLYVYSPIIDFKTLRKWVEQRMGAFPIPESNFTLAVDHVLFRKKDFIIFVNDTDRFGADFGDFYYLGKQVLENDKQIESICGASNGIWSDREMGDVFWLSESKCQYGQMLTRRALQPDFQPFTGISLRPEVGRVGDVVTTDSEWNVDKFTVSMLKKDAFEMRLEYDIAAAEKLPIEAWKLGTIVPKDQINMFMYENREDLVEKYGIENEKIHMYKGIVSMSFKGVRAYIVPPHIYQRQIIE